jgi:MFS family permease
MSRAGRDPLLTAPFLRLWAFAFITFLSAFQLFPTIPYRILALGGTRTEAGWFLAVYTYASAFSAPLTGAIADHIGRKKVLVVASSVFVVFSLLYGVIPTLPLLLIVGCIHGVLWSGILASSAALMTELIPPARRTEGIAYWGMASTAAVAVAPSIGLTIYHQGGWALVCGGMSLLSVVMLWLASRVSVSQLPHRGGLPALRNLFDWKVVALSTSLAAIAFGYGGVTSFVAMLASERHLSPTSLFFNVFAVTILVMRIFTARIGDRHGHAVLLYPSLLVCPIALALLALANSILAIGASAFLFGLGFGGAYPAFAAFVIERSDPARRAGTFGSIIWAFDTGIGTGSLVTGALIDHVGFTAAFGTGAALATLAIPLFALLAPRLFPGRGTVVASV